MKKTFYILIDASGSMYGHRADAVNAAMHDVVETVLPQARNNPEPDSEISVGIIAFSDRFQNNFEWVIPKTSIDDFPQEWTDLESDYFYGGTPTGAVIAEVIRDCEVLNHGEVDHETVPPIILLISDGEPNGIAPTYEEVLERVEHNNPLYSQNFRRSTRIAIGINVDEKGRESLKKFGRITRSMEGFSPYYDCTDSNLDELVEMVKRITTGATM